MRLTRPQSSRPGGTTGNDYRVPGARLLALLGVLGLVLVLALPAIAAPAFQGNDGEQEGAEQGRRGTPVPTAGATGLAGAGALATPVASPEAGSPGATPIAEPTLQGVFSVGISEVDLPPGLAGAPALVGLWNLNLNADGTYTVSRQDVGPVVSGRYTAVGETLTLEDWTGIISCGLPEESGATYAWRLVEDSLTLTPISDTCGDREILFTTRALGSFEPCATQPLVLPAAPPGGPGGVLPPAPPLPGGIAVGTPGATPVAEPVPEGEPAEPDVQEAIEALLRQADGCWATGDPARFLALHSRAALVPFVQFPQLVSDVAAYMAAPASFELIGNVRQLGPDRAWAYVEITFAGQVVPQRLDFVRENGVWLFDYIFLLPPPPPGAPPLP